MLRKEYKKYFDVLEISPDASLSQIKSAYLMLKRLYSAESVVMSPIADEFPYKRRQQILKQIEEAYTALTSLLYHAQNKSSYRGESLTSKGGPEDKKETSTPFSGSVLRQIRKERGIGLYEVALDTKIRVEILENIELERFEVLPQEVYLKGHISVYANYLLLDPKKAADDYIKKYREWKSKIEVG
ncbi:MAG: helix-turn-helix domain-containing protein [Candidatus Aminicenantes bacterium]|nr:helix-turn-helix domain-containing protein [Candidatus Aminicenantes bacterium]